MAEWRTAESGRVLVLLLGRGLLGLGAGTLVASVIRNLPWCSWQTRRRGCRNTKASMFAGPHFQQVCKEAWAWGLPPRGSRQRGWGWPGVPHRRRGGSGCWMRSSGLGGRTRSTCPRLIHQSKGVHRAGRCRADLETAQNPSATRGLSSPEWNLTGGGGRGEEGSWHGQAPSGPKPRGWLTSKGCDRGCGLSQRRGEGRQGAQKHQLRPNSFPRRGRLRRA